VTASKLFLFRSTAEMQSTLMGAIGWTLGLTTNAVTKAVLALNAGGLTRQQNSA
jgi:hypothetical protein